MNRFAHLFSARRPRRTRLTQTCVLLVAFLAAGAASAEPGVTPRQPAPTPALAPDIVAASKKPSTIPSLATMPEPAKDMRTPAQWRALVIEVRQAGAMLDRRAAQEPWTLNDTDAWARAARAEATPPPSAETYSEGDTEAFVKAMRARATPPPRH